MQVDVDTEVAIQKSGPFEPLGAALLANAPLRDVLARDIPIPSLSFSVLGVAVSYARLRTILLALVVVPLAMLLELDRELIVAKNTSVSRVVVDLVLTAWIVFELSRPTPRMPRITALALLAVSLRWTLVATRLCGHVHVLVYVAASLCALAAIVFATIIPPRSRIALELLDKLGITRTELFASTATRDEDEPPGALVAASIGCAAGLPAILHLVRMLGANLPVQAIVFVGFGVLAPIAARRLVGEPTPISAPAPKGLPPARILIGVAIGLALTAAAITAARLFFDVGTELARCVDRLDAEARLAHNAEAAELTRALAAVRASAPLVIMTAAVFPFAEERIYRGLLQDVLARKYGSSYGVFAASLAFGVAHLGIYQVALYQTVLLGIGFGVAFAEGGLLAAFVVHATWNLVQLL